MINLEFKRNMQYTSTCQGKDPVLPTLEGYAWNFPIYFVFLRTFERNFIPKFLKSVPDYTILCILVLIKQYICFLSISEHFCTSTVTN